MIFHIDMDAFFAAIEIVKNPELRGKPVIIGGNPDRRGVVSTCSYEARKFGVHSAMPLSEAKRLCPQAIFVSGDYSLYGEISREIMAIFRSITPYVQIMSIDEAYLDVTHLNEHPTKQLAAMIHRQIYETTQLTCSIGIAENKMMAKIGSSHAKPNGLCFIPPGDEPSFLHPLPIEIIPGIGKKTLLFLHEEGIRTIGDVQSFSQEQLIEKFGNWGDELHDLAHGIYDHPVRWLPRIPKSMGEERTFEEDTQDLPSLLDTLHELIREVTTRLQRKGMRARGISIKLRDERFRTFTRAKTLFTHTQSLDNFIEEFTHLFLESYPQGMWVRLVGVTLERLTKEAWQPTLWNWERDDPPSSSIQP